MLLAPVVKGRKGHYRELFENLRKNGFISVRVDGELREMKIGMSVDRYKMHDIEIVVDKIVMDQIDLKRLKNSVATAIDVYKRQQLGFLYSEGNDLGYNFFVIEFVVVVTTVDVSLVDFFS